MIRADPHLTCRANLQNEEVLIFHRVHITKAASHRGVEATLGCTIVGPPTAEKAYPGEHFLRNILLHTYVCAHWHIDMGLLTHIYEASSSSIYFMRL